VSGEKGELLMALVEGQGIEELGFREAVYAVVRCVPAGRVCSYGDVAFLVGRPRAPRLVGQALAALQAGREVPWWRVIRTDGSIAMKGDPVRPLEQKAHLRREGVVLSEGRVNMRRFRWRPDLSGAQP